MRPSFGILGPIALAVGDAPVPIRSTLVRGALGMLLLEANQFVSSERLINCLWSDPPSSAGANLRQHISRLRSHLADYGLGSRITTYGSAYRLTVDHGELDAHVFVGLTKLARAYVRSDELGRADDLLGQALALWRGEPGHDVPRTRSLIGRLDLLRELRSQAQHDRVEIRLRLGETTDSVHELRLVLAENPTKDRAWDQLIRALYCRGEVSDALTACSQARMSYRELLGADLPPRLADLHRAVLHNDTDMLLPRQPDQGINPSARTHQPVLDPLVR